MPDHQTTMWYKVGDRSLPLCSVHVELRGLHQTLSHTDSAKLKGPRKLSRIQPEIFDFEPDLGLKLGQTKPKISGTVPTIGTQRFRTILGRFRRVSTTIRKFQTVR